MEFVGPGSARALLSYELTRNGAWQFALATLRRGAPPLPKRRLPRSPAGASRSPDGASRCEWTVPHVRPVEAKGSAAAPVTGSPSRWGVQTPLLDPLPALPLAGSRSRLADQGETDRKPSVPACDDETRSSSLQPPAKRRGASPTTVWRSAILLQPALLGADGSRCRLLWPRGMSFAAPVSEARRAGL
jgi:hypothetical protein